MYMIGLSILQFELQENFMKTFIALFVVAASLLFAEPTTIRQEEKDQLKYIDAVRAHGFADRILDRLHKSIALNVTRIKELADKII